MLITGGRLAGRTRLHHRDSPTDTPFYRQSAAPDGASPQPASKLTRDTRWGSRLNGCGKEQEFGEEYQASIAERFNG
jgi:hypothetical protein